MRQKLKFGAVARRGLMAGHETRTRLLTPTVPAKAVCRREPAGLPCRIGNLKAWLGGESRSLITNHNSPITAFLIGTLPIRIMPKSFDCFIGAHSNRHSSDALKFAFSAGGGQHPSRPLLGISPTLRRQAGISLPFIRGCALDADCAKVHSSVLSSPSNLSGGSGIIEKASDQ
jgi:hypothetical protein